MSTLLLHPLNKQQLRHYQQAPGHALLLSGPVGSGKLAVAEQLAEQLLGLPEGSLATYSYRLQLRPENSQRIGIEAIRELEHFMSLKVPSEQAINRVVIIEESHSLTLEAQNALLKTLEEPADGTLLILTAARTESLLPTIRSRVQIIQQLRPIKSELVTYFSKQGYEAPAIQQAYVISGGLIGLMHAFLGDETHPLRVATAQARQLLSQPLYQRLLQVEALSRERDVAAQIVFILQQMAHVSLQTATGASTRRWQAVLKAAYSADVALQASAQPKLTLTNLMLYL